MTDDTVEKTRRTAALYFEGVSEEKPFDLWRAFDKELALDYRYEKFVVYLSKKTLIKPWSLS